MQFIEVIKKINKKNKICKKKIFLKILFYKNAFRNNGRFL